MLYIVYLIVFVLFWWSFQGYFLYIYLMAKAKKAENKAPGPLPHDKKFFIIVPSYNEEGLIVKKIENIKKITYPQYEVCFVDASSDQTPQIISSAISGLPNFKLIRASQPGRSFQLNQALCLAQADYIVITDVDAMMQSNALQVMREEFEDESLGVIAGYVRPATAYETDASFWRSQNMMRSLESIYGHSPVACGAGYAFRTEIIETIPKDVQADDIYIAFTANLKGFRSIYSPAVAIEELRAPGIFKEFLKDKVRKAQNNIRELFRFFPQVFMMKWEWLIVYLTRFIQVILSPMITISLLVLVFFQNNAIIASSIIVLICSWLLQRRFIGQASIEGIGSFEAVKTFILTEYILGLALGKYILQRGKILYLRTAGVTSQ